MYRSTPERNPFFIGRERILTELDVFFSSLLPHPLKIVALLGMPGIGKTEIALEYTYRSFGKYQAVVWLDAPSRHQLAEQVSRTFGMKLPWKTVEERERIFEAFRRWLWGYQSSFLLVLDQIGDYSLLNDVLDENMEGHVLVTHSSRETADELRSLMVWPFDEQESSLFLLRRAGLLATNSPLTHASPVLQQTASAISQAFGGHPLALDQAGAYISETRVSLVEYLVRYRENPRALLDRRGTDSPLHPFSAYAVIAAMRQGAAYGAQELLFLYVRGLIDCSDPSPQLPPDGPSADLRHEAENDPNLLLEMRAALIYNFLLVPHGHGEWGIHPLVRTVMLEVIAWLQEIEKQSIAKNDRYEPLDLEGIFQVLVSVQQMKKQLRDMPPSDPKTVQLVRDLATIVLRFQYAVLPGPREQREEAKSLLEQRYGEMTGNTSPLDTASQDELRHYAQKLFALMQYR